MRRPVSASRAVAALWAFTLLVLGVAGAGRQRPASGSATVSSEGAATSYSTVQIAGLDGLGVPAPLARAPGMGMGAANASGVLAAAANPTATVNVKRIFLQNRCRCTNPEGGNAAYPLVALSYVPVAASQFYTVRSL